MDSELVLGHINGKFEVKESRLKELSKKVQELMTKFIKVEVMKIRRELNARADALAKGVAHGDYTEKREN